MASSVTPAVSASGSGSGSVSVVIVGCGSPFQSMGGYHAVQILDGRVPDATLTDIVEPFYLSAAAQAMPTPHNSGYTEFHTWREQLLQHQNAIRFHEHVAAIPPRREHERRLIIISARTAENPKLFQECLAVGCDGIYLEKPGAPSVAQLEIMRDQAQQAQVPVYMGFNKNVSSYVQLTQDFVKKYTSTNTPKKLEVTFLHNNNYAPTPTELAECFERNAEGMLKNMLIHELAICVTFYHVTVETIATITADTEYSSLQTFTGPASGKSYTDFKKLKFQIRTTQGLEINVAADRCGGDESVGIVTEARAGGTEVARFRMPDPTTLANIPVLAQKYGAHTRPYFLTQDPDYLQVKTLVVQNIVHGTAHPATGVADITIAIETLKVAEYLTPILHEQLK